MSEDLVPSATMGKSCLKVRTRRGQLMTDTVQINLMPNGPIIVEGDFRVADAAGANLAEGKNRVALCRCGASQKKPFCDGSHGRIGFQG